MKKYFDYLYYLTGLPFIFLTIATSRNFTLIKIVLLSTIFFVSICEVFFINNGKLVRFLFKYILIFVSYFMISLCIGIVSGYPFDFINDFSLIQYFFITPIFILIISEIFYLNSYRTDIFEKILKYVTLIVLILDLNKILSFILPIPDFDFFNLIMVSSSNMYSNELTLRVSNEVNLMFLLPFFIVQLFEGENNKKDELLYILIFLLGALYAVLSGRKVLEIVIVGALVFELYRLFNKKWKTIIKVSILILLFFPIILFLLKYIENLIGLNNIFEQAYLTIKEGFSNSSRGVVVRKNYFNSLIDLWLNSIIMGNGLNSHAAVLASNTTLWSYEIVYVALLAQTGLIGVSIFFYGVIYIVYKLYRLYKKNNKKIYLSCLVAFISFIFCGSSNPLVYIIWPWIFIIANLYREKQRGV